MIKLYNSIKLFFDYRKFVKEQKMHLLDNFALNVNTFNEMYTTIILSDAPDEIKKTYGDALPEYEIKNYIKKLNKYFEKFGMTELINVYEIKKINNELYGVAFGFSLINNKTAYLILYSILLLFALISVITFIIIF
jgi:hypothetical protein